LASVVIWSPADSRGVSDFRQTRELPTPRVCQPAERGAPGHLWPRLPARRRGFRRPHREPDPPPCRDRHDRFARFPRCRWWRLTRRCRSARDGRGWFRRGWSSRA